LKDSRRLAAAAVVLLHANRQRLDAAQNQPALEGRKNRSRAFLKEGKFSACSGFVQTTTPPRPSLCPLRNFVSSGPPCRRRTRSTLKVWRHEGVVDHHLNAVPVAEFGEGAEIAQFHQRVVAFPENEPRVFLKRAFNFFEIRSIDVGKCQAEVDQD